MTFPINIEVEVDAEQFAETIAHESDIPRSKFIRYLFEKLDDGNDFEDWKRIASTLDYDTSERIKALVAAMDVP